jgi:hypothetical protein
MVFTNNARKVSVFISSPELKKSIIHEYNLEFNETLNESASQITNYSKLQVKRFNV